MPLPERIRVKLSSEAAETITITPVVVQEMSVRELVEHMLGVTGKDAGRIRQILEHGTLVSGGSRFRWAGWDAEPAGIDELLATFPDSEPQRPFAPERCVRAVLRGARQSVEIPRAAGERKSWLRRRSFWDALMAAMASAGLEYEVYSYKDRADRYRARLSPSVTEELRAAARDLTYATLREQVETGAFTSAELFAER